MFKHSLYLFLFSAFVLLSCNDNDKAVAGTDASSMPAGEKELRDLVKQYPDSLPLRNKLVDYFANNSDYQNAIKEINIIIQKDSNNAGLWDAKARLHFLNADTMAAINGYEHAISIYPDPQYVIALGTLYAQSKNPLALSMADALLQAPKANATLQALFIKGLYYTYSGDKPTAISFFDKCIATDYTFMDAYREKAIALYDMGKYEDAISFLQKTITVKRSFDEAWYWLGRCYEKLNRNKEAVESYQFALQIDPEYIEAKDALGKLGIKQ